MRENDSRPEGGGRGLTICERHYTFLPGELSVSIKGKCAFSPTCGKR